MLLHNVKTTVPLCTTLKDHSHKQPPTPIETDKSTALGISKYIVKKSMDVIFYLFKDRTHQWHFFIYRGPGKTKKSDYFTKHNPPSYHTVISHKYLNKANYSISFVPPQDFINYGLVLNSTNIIHEPRGPKSDHQEPGGSMSECIRLVPKKIFPKSNRQ